MADSKAKKGGNAAKKGGTAPKKKTGNGGGKKTAPKKKATAKRDTAPAQPREVTAADLPENLKGALTRIVNYSWDDEQRSAEEFARENGNVDGHVFADLVAVRNFLEGKNDDPMSLLDVEDGEGDEDDEDADDE